MEIRKQKSTTHRNISYSHYEINYIKLDASQIQETSLKINN